MLCLQRTAHSGPLAWPPTRHQLTKRSGARRGASPLNPATPAKSLTVTRTPAAGAVCIVSAGAQPGVNGALYGLGVMGLELTLFGAISRVMIGNF